MVSMLVLRTEDHGCEPWSNQLVLRMEDHGCEPWSNQLVLRTEDHGCEPWSNQLVLRMEDHGCEGQIKPKTIKLVFVTSLLSMQHSHLYTNLLQYFKWEFLKTLNTCSCYYHMEIHISIQHYISLDHCWQSNCPFWLKYFIKRFVRATQLTIPINFECLHLIYEDSISLHNFIWSFSNELLPILT